MHAPTGGAGAAADKAPPSGCPIHAPADKAAPQESACPVARSVSADEPLDPTNYMPSPNQQRAEGQRADLSVDRVQSSIPRGQGAEEGSWVYPSEQMFYNALVRKGKGDGVDESAMGAVVAIHNNMNERAWDDVLRWESRHSAECADPRLVRFMGRPDELTPKARAKMALGLADRPFDRHDWIVDRCGKEARRRRHAPFTMRAPPTPPPPRRCATSSTITTSPRSGAATACPRYTR